MTTLRIMIAALALTACGSAAAADAIESAFRGKTITIVCGMPPPGQHDTDARLLAKHMGKHIPGHPAIVVETMPGAGSLKAALYMAKIAPKDGLTIGVVQGGVLLMPLLGYAEATFDPTQLAYLGTRAPDTTLVALWRDAPAKTLEEAKSREVILGSTGGGADSNTLPLIYNETLGTKFKMVSGYASGGAINLAMERREVDGRAGWALDALRATQPNWLADKTVNVILQLAVRKNPSLPDTPLAQDVAIGAENRELLTLFANRQGIGLPVFLPPGAPADRVAALRAAFSQTLADPDYVADARALRSDVDPIDGAAMQGLVQAIYATSKPVVDRARRVFVGSGG